MLLAAAASLLPRERWAVFLVTPQTLVRWHVAHYNAGRPHRSLALAAPAGPTEARASPPGAEIRRRDALGGLIHEYYAAAA